MTEPDNLPRSGPGPPRGQQVESLVQIVIMLAIGGAAGAASFTHVYKVASAHGQPGWLAWADAIVLELTSVASGLELRRRKRIGKSTLFPALMLTVAVTLSLAAQVVEAERSVIGWLAAALPAVGFLAMVKIAMGRADPGQHGPAVIDGGLVPAAIMVDQAGTALTVRDHGPDIMALVPAARTAAEHLAALGIALSRTSLSARLRAEGHSLSNATASALVRLLRTEPGPAESGDRA